MLIYLTPHQFTDLLKVIETSRAAISSSVQGMVELKEDSNTDSIEWDAQEVKIILED